MLDFLEADWDVCVKQSKMSDGTSDTTALQHSLVWHYIVGHDRAPTNRTRRRRMVKAILATATPESRRDYSEIWDKEIVEPKRKADEDQPIQDIDFETGELADYGSDDDMQDASDDSDEESVNETSLDHPLRNIRDAIDHLGGQDAIELRQRLIALVRMSYSSMTTN
jgi:hypothetical protein